MNKLWTLPFILKTNLTKEKNEMNIQKSLSLNSYFIGRISIAYVFHSNGRIKTYQVPFLPSADLCILNK